MKKVVVFSMMMAACALVTQVSARPAAPDFQTVSNKDGSSVAIRYFGDEHFRYAETSDGYLVTYDSLGNCVYVGEDGKASGVVARNVGDRTDAEKEFLNKLDQGAARENHQKLKVDRFPDDSSLTQNSLTDNLQTQSVTASKSSIMYRPTPEKWTVGERWFPVILVGTEKNHYSDSAAYYDFLNKPGYNKNKHIGSLRDYFLFVSDSLFDPHFDVYPVKISMELNQFVSGGNLDEGKLVAMGIDTLVKRADFLKNADKYCSKGKNVDGFFFLFPGREEDVINLSEDFWSHQFSMSGNGSTTRSFWFYSSSYAAGGYNFDKYVFNAQLADGRTDGSLNKLGILVHELSHILGLMDHYGRDANNNQIAGPGKFDLMSLGMYNGTSTNAGNIPMGYSAFEKETVGWLTLEDLQPDSIYTLKKLSKLQAYSVTNPNHNDEYYIVEYRPAEMYDAYVAKSFGEVVNGIYVWYIDYNQKAFLQQNNANGDASHQRVAINAVLAANKYYADFTYVNKSGTTSVPGVYNVVLDGDRACFTTSKNISLKECPAESSSSIESSSSEASSSSVKSSSSAASSSSQAVAESSSGEKNNLPMSSSEAVNRVVAGFAMPQSRMVLEGRTLHVSTDAAGDKSIRLFDMQGHLVQAKKFLGSAVTLDFGNMKCGAYMVRLMAGNRTIAVKTLALKNN